MTLPATIRINARVPFPALVTGAGFVTVSKLNSIWTVSVDYTKLSPLNTPSDLPGSFVAIYDPLTKLYNQVTASQIASLASSLVSRTQRSITGSGQLPIVASDSILNFNAASDLTPSIPLASTRNGAPITINNLPGSHTQTISRVGSDTFDALTSIAVLAGQRLTIWPYNDGVNAGYFID